MSKSADFIEAVKQNMPETVRGARPHSVRYPETLQNAVVVAVLFQHEAGDNVAYGEMHITASGREISMNEGDLDGLAKRRIAAAIASIPKDEPFFEAA